jgi:two-component system, OmpR family, sensor histidine kinase KdpD
MDLKRIAAVGGGYPLAITGVAVTALVLLPFREVLPSLTVMMLFVPVIAGIASITGVRASAAAAVLGFLVLDFFFVPPYYRWSVADVSGWLGLLVFLIVALVSGQQTARLREREREAVRGREELALLNRLSFRIASEKSASAVAEYVASQVVEILSASRAALWSHAADGTRPRCIARAGADGFAPNEERLVEWVLRSSKAVGMPSAEEVPYDLRVVSVAASEAIEGVHARGVYVPLQTADGLEGVLFADAPDAGHFSAEDGRLLAAIANLAASALERERLAEDAAHAEALREADRLKSTLVSSVSHELKTPLAAATARVTGLVEEGEGCDASRMHSELIEVADDLGRLNASIGDLLDLSRLEADAWEPRFEAHEVRDILGTVLSRQSASQRDRVHFDIAEDVGDVRADFAQLARAISNLVENALAYSPPGSDVVVGARLRDRAVRLWVEDSGPGIPDAEKPHIFEKFHRGTVAESAPTGTGLGLAIAREIVRTHEGTLGVEDVVPHGARFVLTIPAAAPADAGVAARAAADEETATKLTRRRCGSTCRTCAARSERPATSRATS